MKKRILLMAMLSAAILGNTPVKSQAAEVKLTKVQMVGCHKLFIGQDMKSLQQILDELGIAIGNSGNNCPDIQQPDTETPDTEATETEKPGTETMAPETPETEKPGTETTVPETPETEKPGTETTVPETPETEKPETETTAPETPETEKPGTDITEKDDSTALSYEKQVTKLVNEERAKAGLPALELQTDITAAANVRAKEIKQTFSHTRPNGSSFSTVLKELGVSFRGAGENIAYGQKTPEQVMNGWMNSEGHRANILNPNFKNIGVGYYQDERGVNHWVQLFTY